MRDIKFIAVHCTATSQTTSISAIQNYWKNHLGWNMPGYHFIVLPGGKEVNLLTIDKVSNGVRGFNSQTINIAYLGGVDAQGKPLDNRTLAQKTTLLNTLRCLKKQFPNAVIQGHRDFPNVAKACPSFDAKKEYHNL
ncbi:N-acetylmuramoyl-L-alanine amidase [Microcoleus sp. herbarium8]